MFTHYAKKLSLLKIDVLKIVFLVFISSIFYMHATAYYDYCFPNCYAWKELMIKWTNGELVRRGLLGTIFYLLEPYISISVSSVIFLYGCVLCTSYVLYSYLKKLNLPIWLFFLFILSPSLVLFNLHYVLVIKKDIVAIFGCVVLLLFTEYYWNNKFKPNNTSLLKDVLIYVIAYVYFFVFFLLCYEIFISFVPFVCLHIFLTISRYYDIKKSFVISISILLFSIFLFALLILPYLENQNLVLAMVKDWKVLYPSLEVFYNRPDPFFFMLLDFNQYKNYYLNIVNKTNFLEFLLIYILTFIPVFFLCTFKYVSIKIYNAQLRLFYERYKILCVFLLVLVIHIPLLSLSMVAFDYGRWLVLSFYTAVLFSCFCTKSNEAPTVRFCFLKSNQKIKRFLCSIMCILLCVLYLFTWQPQHWSGDFGLVDFNQLSIYKNIIRFYTNLIEF